MHTELFLLVDISAIGSLPLGVILSGGHVENCSPQEIILTKRLDYCTFEEDDSDS